MVETAGDHDDAAVPSKNRTAAGSTAEVGDGTDSSSSFGREPGRRTLVPTKFSIPALVDGRDAVGGPAALVELSRGHLADIQSRALCDEFEGVTGSVNCRMTLDQFSKAMRAKNKSLASILFERMNKSSSDTLSCNDFVSGMSVIRNGSLDARLEFAFHLYDINRSGSIEKADIVKMLRICLPENRVDLDEEQLARMAIGMMHTLDVDRDGTLSLADFSNIEAKYPGLALIEVERLKPNYTSIPAEVPSSPRSPFKRKLKTSKNGTEQRSPNGISAYNNQLYIEKKSKASSAILTASSMTSQSAHKKNDEASFFNSMAKLLMTAWYWMRNNKQQVFCMLMMLAMFGAAFYITSETFCMFQGLNCGYANKELREIFGWGLTIAKGSAGSAKVAFAIIIFPVCRNTITVLRETFLRKLIPFDDAIAWHKIIAAFGFFFSFLHVFAHVWNFYVFSSPSRRTAFERTFGKDTPQPSIISLWTTSPAITGLVMCAILLVTFTFAMEWPRQSAWLKDTAIGRVLNNFNNFAATHCLFVVFYLCFIFHAFPKPYGYGDVWCWVAIPLGIYLTEKIFKCWNRRRRHFEILDATVMPGNAVCLQISKPKDFKYLSGQYIFICLPDLAWMEWHPFTLTSAPDDDFLSLHIRAAGDWTRALSDLIRDVTARREKAMDEDLERGGCNSTSFVSGGSCSSELPSFPKVHVDGPFGAPAQTWRQFKTVVMIGAGIGVTPCASVLRDVLRNIHGPDGSGDQSMDSGNEAESTALTKRVFFYWCAREKEETSWFRHELESIARIDTHKVLDINIHITSVKGDSGVAPNFLKMGQMASHAVHGRDVMTGMETNFITKFGRPDWEEVLQNVAHSCGPISSGKSPEKVGVFFCGPPIVAQTLSRTCTALNSAKELPARFAFYQEHF